MSWRESFALHFGPGALCGATFGDWWRVLGESGYDVAPRRWPRAAAITWGSAGNSLFAAVERWRYAAAVSRTRPEPPIFILGSWRSGTTHLHNLMARDPRLAYPNFLDAFYPHTFLSMGWMYGPLLAAILPRARPQDNVRMALNEPQEDEFALNCLCQCSWVMALTFPRRAEHFERFITFQSAAPDETQRFQAALRDYVQKLAFKYRRPLVLKSPAHTARIRLLLEVFPDARFVFIHRNPYDVAASMLHMIRTVVPWWTLQDDEAVDAEEQALRQLEQVFSAYFEQRSLIPAGRLHELAFERLECDPTSELAKMYAALAMPDFEAARPPIERYLAALGDYRKNALPPLPPAMRECVASRLQPCFEAFGYAV